MDDLFPGLAIGVGLGFVVSIVVHHFAHARAAIAMGDRSPRLHGRVSLSIKAHADPLGTVILPIVWMIAALFVTLYPYVGWGKPQTFQAHLMRNPKRGIIITSLAGPAATLVLGVVAARVAISFDPGFSRQVIAGIAYVAVFLTIWELLPMPGRDGGRILAEFLSPTGKLKMQDLAQYEVLFVVGVFLLLSFVVTFFANRICLGAAGMLCSSLPF